MTNQRLQACSFVRIHHVATLGMLMHVLCVCVCALPSCCCRWVGILAWGEGWHNNHHAFEASARHGLEWWQVDITWYIIAAMEKLGLINNVKLPSEKAKARLAFPKAA